MSVARVTVALAVALIAALGAARSAAASGSWRELHRPLDLPQLDAGQPCPVSGVDQRVKWEKINIFGAWGIGRGPAYPGLGGAETPGDFHAPDQVGDMFGQKLFWYVSPSYRGRVLVRGHQIDGVGDVAWKRRGASRSELRIKPGETVGWKGRPEGARGVPTETLVSGSGCYAVQIDGTRFSRTVVFSASTQ